MANLKRHFNFSTKPSTIGPQNSANSTEVPSATFDRHNLMTNICSCLDICSSYIQALNALCGTGSLLARSLLQTVQNVPAYQNVAQQFFCMWDEVGKATAGASAAVKTETLMMLQEVLNTLEMGAKDNPASIPNAESFQVIGSCLYSLIELQAQFSMSTWKSLSKLSKNFSSDAFIHSLHWKSHDRNPLKTAKNSELISTIKKHYSHLLRNYELQKPCDATDVPQSQFYVVPTAVNNSHVTNSQHDVQTECVTSVSPKPVVWSPGTTLWPSPNDSEKRPSPSPPTGSRITRIGCSGSSAINDVGSSTAASSSPSGHSELDEVINLLSCMPIEQFPSSISDQSSGHAYESSLLRSYQFWPPGGGPVLSRHQRPWSDGAQDINFGYDSWIWRADNMNCSALPNGQLKEFSSNDQRNNQKNSWNHPEFQMWSTGTGENGSSSDDTSSNQGQELDSLAAGLSSLSESRFFPSARQRRCSSSDHLSDAQETIQETDYRCWNNPVHKTSTWPLKQSTSRTVDDWGEGAVDAKYLPLYYTHSQIS